MLDAYRFNTCMGKCENQLPFLTVEQQKEIDNIGYTGRHSNGKRMTRTEYLSSQGLGDFEITTTKRDSGDFCESFILSRANVSCSMVKVCTCESPNYTLNEVTQVLQCVCGERYKL